MIEGYVEKVFDEIFKDQIDKDKVITKFLQKFKNRSEDMCTVKQWKAACRIISKKLVNGNLALRKQLVGELLKTIRTISQQSVGDDTFEEGSHTVSSEPYFHDAGYKDPALQEVTIIDRKGRSVATKLKSFIDENEYSLEGTIIAVDRNGRCYLELEDLQSLTKMWKCNMTCKTFSDKDRQRIVELKNVFTDESVEEVRYLLQILDDGCEHGHYSKYCEVDTKKNSHESSHFKKRKGHPLPCSSDCCNSWLRILRAGAVHHPVLRTLLNNIYRARRSDSDIRKVESSLSEGCIQSLINNLKLKDLSVLLDDEEEEEPSPTIEVKPLSTSDSHLEVEFAAIIEQFHEKLKHDPEFTCCSCERLLTEKAVTHFNISTEKFNSSTWMQLQNYLRDKDPDVGEKTLYVCTHCRPILNEDNMPGRCVLNGLYTEPVPEELSNLNALENQFIQRAKCFQTVVRLGTYTGKVPLYNCLKAVKGTMFFLPLPLQNTLDRLDEAGFKAEYCSDASLSLLPDPELYIIVDSRPTKDKIVWQGLVDIDNVRRAVQKLRDTNWLYRNVDDSRIDEATSKTLEVVSGTTSTVLERASEDDVHGLQAYTIRKMDQYMPTGKDIDHYKLLSVSEKPLDNRQKYLDVLCFPSLFPTGQYGEFHPREVKLTFSEYIKSRLMNSDSRFRKSPEFVFYYLWHKEMRELSAGIYNALNSTNKRHLSVKQFVDGVNGSDAAIEANLSTVLQSVRGTKQFWFLKKSDVMAMIREYGSPTLFLTLSCAEYEAPDIERYLRKVNDVSGSYPIGRLCTEDPISVSRKFSQKFQDFFTTVLLQGQVLGEVSHFFWKKEYQSRGAPHYHVLLWIKDAPIIKDGSDNEKVLKWIQSIITCRIPDEKASPELHRLVTKFQMHKCSTYCKRKKKWKHLHHPM